MCFGYQGNCPYKCMHDLYEPLEQTDEAIEFWDYFKRLHVPLLLALVLINKHIRMENATSMSEGYNIISFMTKKYFEKAYFSTT